MYPRWEAERVNDLCDVIQRTRANFVILPPSTTRLGTESNRGADFADTVPRRRTTSTAYGGPVEQDSPDEWLGAQRYSHLHLTFVVCHPIPANINSISGTRLIVDAGLSSLITTTDW